MKRSADIGKTVNHNMSVFWTKGCALSSDHPCLRRDPPAFSREQLLDSTAAARQHVSLHHKQQRKRLYCLSSIHRQHKHSAAAAAPGCRRRRTRSPPGRGRGPAHSLGLTWICSRLGVPSPGSRSGPDALQRILTTSPRHRQAALTRSLGLGRRSPPQRSQTGRSLARPALREAQTDTSLAARLSSGSRQRADWSQGPDSWHLIGRPFPRRRQAAL